MMIDHRTGVLTSTMIDHRTLKLGTRMGDMRLSCYIYTPRNFNAGYEARLHT